jgi:hypothetical protein
MYEADHGEALIAAAQMIDLLREVRLTELLEEACHA